MLLDKLWVRRFMARSVHRGGPNLQGNDNSQEYLTTT